ncbi:hypothetical protein E9G_00473 [Moraxella catarrhalis 7169]|uniref:hypothetical protein n=1 Tax=Moraxella catarrhalis TaxID=480 RepID=UPI0002029BB1|nr:hypothetical protein [Moraxella catarrhalis]EGE12402.1 hypothetical protein E9G_00473 [Moraxella catarrhalis 7169]
MTDKELIEKLGGVSSVAHFLGSKYNTVYNWTYRGIPSKVKLDNLAYFTSAIKQTPKKSDD